MAPRRRKADRCRPSAEGITNPDKSGVPSLIASAHCARPYLRCNYRRRILLRFLRRELTPNKPSHIQPATPTPLGRSRHYRHLSIKNCASSWTTAKLETPSKLFLTSAIQAVFLRKRIHSSPRPALSYRPRRPWLQRISERPEIWDNATCCAVPFPVPIR